MKKSAYESLKNLPGYELMDQEFDISEIETEKPRIKDVSRKLIERIDQYCRLTEEIIHPESNIAAMHEAEIIGDMDKTKVMELFQKLMYYKRMGIEIDLKHDEDKTEFINQFVKEWPGIKHELIKILTKLKNSWTVSINSEKLGGYFG